MFDRALFQGKNLVFFLLLPVTIFIKVSLASIGQSIDVVAWAEVSRIVRSGGIVYASFESYNYGPIWAWLLGLIGYCSEVLPLSSFPKHNFHMWVALFLSLVDIAMAATLRRAGYPKAALAFLLSPMNWLISGFIAQFDQLAILIGLLAVFSLSRNGALGKEQPAFPAGAILLLGLSLVIKHILVFFPVWLGFWWLAREKRGYPVALALAFLPLGIFFFSLLPYWLDPAAWAGIIQNVFHYQFDYLNALAPKLLEWMGLLRPIEEAFSWVPVLSGYKFFWFLILLGVGWACRHKTVLELYLVYLIVFPLFSPVAGWYYAGIALLPCVFFWRFWGSWLYTLLSTLCLLYHSVRVLRGLPWVKELWIAPFLDYQYYKDFPRYLPFVLLPLLLWKVSRERIPGDQPGLLASKG